MSHDERDRWRKKLRRLISTARDDLFFDLCWAVEALQNSRAPAASRHLSYPAEAAEAPLGSAYKIYPWELETLLMELLLVPKMQLREGPNRVLDCGQFSAIASVVNALRKLENAESGIYLRRIHIFDELHRIAQREFPWQSGYFNKVQFYRYAYIYGGPASSEFLRDTYGVSQNGLSLLGFGLHAHFLQHPHFAGKIDLAFLGLAPEEGRAALRLIASSIEDVRRRFQADLSATTQKWGVAPPTAYRPSIFRRFPVVAFRGALRAPLPELILQRVTSGLYYDLAPGGQRLRNEASQRFESYCCDLLRRLLPGFETAPEHHYPSASQKFRSPDLLVSSDEGLVLVIECKASKLSIDAQYSDNPIEIARAGYDELAKGAFQVWRYFSHVRRGIDQRQLAPDALGIVLTLDTWMMMSRELRTVVLAKARDLAAKDAEILEEDQKPIVFCSIKDFEQTLMQSDEEGFLAAANAATTESFTGWLLPNVHTDSGQAQIEKAYPFDMREVLPWVQALDEEAIRRGRSSP